MGLYCPKCLSHEMVLPVFSAVHVVINDSRTESNKILTNSTSKINESSMGDQGEQNCLTYDPSRKGHAFIENLSEKINNLFTLHKSRHINSPIKTIKLFSCDYECFNLCHLKGMKLSVVDHLIRREHLIKILEQAAQKNSVKLEVTGDNID